MSKNDISAVGDHFFVGLQPYPELSDHDRSLLSALKPAGVILYKANFRHDLPYEGWLENHRKLVAHIREVTRREKLIIAIDHEGAYVNRIPPPMTRFSYAVHWAYRAADVGETMGRELASIGVNLNFAPVLDIHSNAANPVIGKRAFGNSPEAVIGPALAFMAKIQAEHVLACGKHFPGHGDTSTDSHYGLPSLDLDVDDLRTRELKPFVAAIQAGIPMLMTSHILFPQVDAGIPVTISRRFGNILRNELGFRGVTISDDIGMRAISGFFEKSDAAVRLIEAGCDILMLCSHWTDTDRSRGFAEAIMDARSRGDLNPCILDQSRERISKLLGHAPQNRVDVLPAAHFERYNWTGVLLETQ
jgi:beta-N-acetylhexosaminidase